MHKGVTAIIAAHPARAKSGLLQRAIQSVLGQTYPVAALSVAMDLDRQGAPATRQRALDMVQTEWVAVLDSDDVWKTTHLEKVMGHALATGADFVYSGHETIPPGHSPLPYTHFTREFDYSEPIETTVTVLVRTGIAKQAGYEALNRGERNTGEDYHFLLRCMEIGAKISCLQEKTWLYDIQGQNTSGLPGRGDNR
jgi:glycosyltransferase involved in cell wall biosynthesis